MEIVSGHLHVSLEFIPGKNRRYPFYGPWNRSEHLREEKYILPLPGMEPQLGAQILLTEISRFPPDKKS
jgi:hypothetical protein